MRAFLITVASVAAVLLYGSPTHHALAAVLLIIGAVPLLRTLEREAYARAARFIDHLRADAESPPSDEVRPPKRRQRIGRFWR